MNDEFILCKVFDSTLAEMNANLNSKYSNSGLLSSKLGIEYSQELESVLKDYLIKIYGFKMNYSPYLKEISAYFESIILNADLKDFKNINSFIVEYTNNLSRKLEDNKLSNILINSIREIYSNDIFISTICNKGDSFIIGTPARDNEEAMPCVIIKNIYSLEHTLGDFLNNVSNNEMYQQFLNNMGQEEGTKYLLQSVLRNATCMDLADVERYFNKYNQFIIDDTFNELISEKYLGTFLGDEMYVKLRKSPISYETPYFLSFFVKSDGLIAELPNIRLGIENINGKKYAHILATQTSQDNNVTTFKKYDSLSECYKTFLGGTNKFREYNPSHVISIILAFGLLKGLKIENIGVVGYMPFRYQRLVVENQKGNSELNDLQYRLTNKHLQSYLRTLEYFDGIDICSYSDVSDELEIFLGDDISTTKKELQELFNMSCSLGNSLNKNNISSSKKY